MMEELRKEITCAVCHELYAEPKVLPCCHYYCKQCIRRLAGQGKPFSCPECSKDFTALCQDQRGVENLPTAFFVGHMKELHSKLEHAHEKVDGQCEMCSGDEMKAFCLQCAQFVCDQCLISHKRMKIFSEHKTVLLSELEDGDLKRIVLEEYPHQKCRLHHEPLKIYCFDCSCLVCRDCTVVDHSGHSYNFIDTVAPDWKEKLIQRLQPLSEIKTNLSLALEQIHAVKSEIETQGKLVADDIENSFKELHNIIENRKQELLQDASTKVTQKLESLSSQEKSLYADFVAVQNVVQYTERCVEYSIGDEVISTYSEIDDYIQRKVEQHRREGKNLEPVEEADIGMEVSCTEDLKLLCQTKAKVTHLGKYPVSMNTEGSDKSSPVNEVAEFFISTKLANGKDTKRRCVVKCVLKSKANGSIKECDVDLIKGNKYRIRYTPTIRGRHELMVTIDGQTCDPFPVFVSISPTKLAKPVLMITGLKHPFDVAIKSNQEIVVTKYEFFDVLDRKGNWIISYKMPRNPCGVTVCGTDTYITDFVNRKIIKLNSKMKAVKEININPGHSVLGLEVVRDNVMITDSRNDCLRVYSTDLHYLGRIGSHGKALGQFDGIRDITSDDRDNMYVSDFNNSRIQVLNKQGDFLYAFGNNSGANSLSGPCGVSFYNQFVFVADWIKNRVSVYTPKGDYVTSFGRRGSSKGEFDCPWGVCVTEDGFVYVCDNSNQRIQVF